MPDQDRPLDTRQAAEFLGAHVETIRRLARRGDLPAYKVGKDWRFRSGALRRWLETQPLRAAKPTVLLVDDEPVVCDVVRRTLENAGCRVITAAGGAEALEAMRAGPTDLVILDLVMPGMDGVATLAKMRESADGLPVVIHTGYPTGDLLARALEFSPVMLLAKPTSPARLIESVRMVLETPHPLPVCPATEWADSARRQLSVSSGEVKTCQGTGLLRASAIGSCVVVAALDPAAAVGGMAHVMLPGASGGGHIPRRWKYARDAVEQMLSSMAALGADAARARVCLVGGANVLGPAHVSPGPEIVESLTGILGGRDIPTVARAVGGTQRRSCTLDVATGCVTCTVGGSATRTLWQPGMDGAGPDRDRRPATREGTREVPT